MKIFTFDFLTLLYTSYLWLSLYRFIINSTLPLSLLKINQPYVSQVSTGADYYTGSRRTKIVSMYLPGTKFDQCSATARLKPAVRKTVT